MSEVFHAVKDSLAALAAGEARWLVGVSGGGDSVALLRLLCEAGLQERIVVGCFNHQWGEFGDTSVAFVEELTGTLGVAYREGTGGGRALKNAEKIARDERIAWMRAVCAEEELAGVLLAHTQDDVVESFLMRAGKGSGLSGLAGMDKEAERYGLMWLRPLLEIGREELREYLRELNQEWLEDPDNVVGGNQRARIRKLLPALEEAGVTLHGMAASIAALKDADAMVRELVEAFPVTEARGELVMGRELLAGAPLELAVRMIGRVIGQITPDEMVVRRSKRVALWQRMCADESGAATLGGAKFTWDKETLRVVPE